MTDHPSPPSASSDPDWDALAQFIAGEGSAEERAPVEKYLQQHPARAALIAALAEATTVEELAAPSSGDVDSALARVRARAGSDSRVAQGPRRVAVRSLDTYRARWRHARLSAAAAVLLVAGAGLLLRTIAGRHTASRAGAVKNLVTAPGVMDSLRLPDGTRVLLGPGSRLTLAADFGAATREMTLAGEARFTVVHDAAHPFVIHTAAATIRDVGTIFSVHSDDADGARVVVTEGAVEVLEHSGASHQTLGAGDVAVIAARGGIEVKRAAAGADDAAWTQGRLVFHDASVTQVTADLRRWYGVEVTVDSALARRAVTASFDRGLSGPDVARIIAATIGGSLRQESGVLRIVSPQAGATPN